MSAVTVTLDKQREPFPIAPIWRGDFDWIPEVPPQRWANGTMHFRKVWRNGNWQLDKAWVPDVPGEEPRSPWDWDYRCLTCRRWLGQKSVLMYCGECWSNREAR